MGKEKKTKTEDQKKETPFYFETIGFISIIFVIIILGRLGKIGSLLTMIFMVVFGDWYWLFVLFILFFGLSNILTHKNFDFKNQKFLGYMIFCVGLLVFSHFSVHNIVINRNGTYFQETWEHYKLFIASQNYDFVLGGGIVGGLIFFVFYYLLGVTGVVLVAIIIIVLGFTMIINKSIVEIVEIIFKKIKGIKRLTGNFNRFFKFELGKKKETPEPNIYTKDKIVPLKIFDEYQNEMNFKFQSKESSEIKSLITSVFNTFNIEYREVGLVVSYAITTYKFFIYSTFDFYKLSNKLKSLINEKVNLIRYNNNLLIEVQNKFVSLVTIKHLLLQQKELNSYELYVGYNTENELAMISLSSDTSILIIGENQSGIKNFIYMMVISMFAKISIKNYEFVLFDEKKEFLYPSLFKKVITDALEVFLQEVIDEINIRNKEITSFDVQEFSEYNRIQEQENKPTMKRKFIVLNINSLNNKLIEDKIIYIIQMGQFCGVNLIIIGRSASTISSVIISIVKTKFIFRVNEEESFAILNNEIAASLASKGESIFVNKEKTERILTPYISNNEIEKVIKFF